MRSAFDNEWVVTNFGEEWRIWIVPPWDRTGEAGPSRADLIGRENPLGDLLYFGFDCSGATRDDTAIALIGMYDALTRSDVLRTLEDPDHPTRDRRGVLRNFDRELSHVIYGAIHLGWLRFERVVPPPWPFLDKEEEPEVSAPPPFVEEQTVFVAIHLVDQDGIGIANRRFRIVLPSGDAREGRLDESGRARVDGIDPGKCVVTFPEFHETDYRAVSPLPGRRSAGERGPAVQTTDDSPGPNAPADIPPDTPETPEVPTPNVEADALAFIIVDESGAPLPGVRFELTSPSGQVIAGTVDDTGSARIDGVEPGSYKLTLPDVEAGAWSVI